MMMMMMTMFMIMRNMMVMAMIVRMMMMIKKEDGDITLRVPGSAEECDGDIASSWEVAGGREDRLHRGFRFRICCRTPLCSRLPFLPLLFSSSRKLERKGYSEA